MEKKVCVHVRLCVIFFSHLFSPLSMHTTSNSKQCHIDIDAPPYCCIKISQKTCFFIFFWSHHTPSTPAQSYNHWAASHENVHIDQNATSKASVLLHLHAVSLPRLHRSIFTENMPIRLDECAGWSESSVNFMQLSDRAFSYDSVVLKNESKLVSQEILFFISWTKEICIVQIQRKSKNITFSLKVSLSCQKR